MFRFVLVVCALSISALALPAPQGNSEINQVRSPSEYYGRSKQNQEELERFQNENAHYSFDADVDDDINDHALHRSETRDGTKVTGMYSYSDGYVRQTVHYVADENGYRVVNKNTEEIGSGPVFNPDGQADVSGSQIGSYSIKLNRDDEEKHYKEIAGH